MKFSLLLLSALIGMCLLLAAGGTTKPEKSAFQLNLRAQTETAPGSGQWQVTETQGAWKPEETAIIICDMWDEHWCQTATERVAEIAPKMNEVVRKARALGVTIVHAPSDVIDFYAAHPARKNMLAAPKAEPPVPIPAWCYLDSTREAALPIDDSDGGCDDPNSSERRAWSRQIASIEIMDADGISDNGEEIYSFLDQRGIKNVVLMGVHTNMCVLGRSFGIRAQKMVGKNVVLARDLTDAMYNPAMPPHVSHWEGVDLVVSHVERYWAPTILGEDVTKLVAANE